VSGENHDNDRRQFIAQLTSQLNSVDAARQIYINNNAVRPQFASKLQSSGRIAGFFADDKFFSGIEEALEPLAHERMILNQNEPLAIVAEHTVIRGHLPIAQPPENGLLFLASEINREINRVRDRDVNVAKLDLAQEWKGLERERFFEDTLKIWLQRRTGKGAKFAVAFAL
jgi:hypothetical protein